MMLIRSVINEYIEATELLDGPGHGRVAKR